MTFFSTCMKYLGYALLCFISTAHGSVTLIGTRIIYPENAKYVNLQFRSPDEVPSIMEVWTSTLNTTAQTAKEANAPFIATPQVFRIDPNQGQTVKLTYTGADLPVDRESVFYLHFLQVPAMKKGNQQANKLVITYRSTVKVFYRPAELKGSSDEVISQLNVDGSRLSSGKLTIHNPTEYHISLDSFAIKNGNQTVAAASGSDMPMIAPFSKQDITVKPLRHASSIHINIINDLGGVSSTQIKL